MSEGLKQSSYIIYQDCLNIAPSSSYHCSMLFANHFQLEDCAKDFYSLLWLWRLFCVTTLTSGFSSCHLLGNTRLQKQLDLLCCSSSTLSRISFHSRLKSVICLMGHFRKKKTQHRTLLDFLMITWPRNFPWYHPIFLSFRFPRWMESILSCLDRWKCAFVYDFHI